MLQVNEKYFNSHSQLWKMIWNNSFNLVNYDILIWYFKTKFLIQNQADTTSTGAVPLTLTCIPKFDLDEFTTVGSRWTKYKNRFANLYVSLNITDNKQKLALLLRYIGEEAYNVYSNLLTPGTE